MIVWYLAIVVLSCWGLRFQADGFRENFLAPDSVAMINGISILVVFVQHLGHILLTPMGYAMDGCGDVAYKIATGWIQQLLVVSFLFFSGFGVMEQIKRKGSEYIANFPRRRILKVWANFAVAVCCFALVNICCQTGVPIRRMIAALTCWRQIGKPSWYIFCVLWCYSATYLTFRLLRKSERFWAGWILIASAAVVYIGLVYWQIPRRTWWYNTIMAYPFGMMVSTFKEPIFGFVRKWYWPCLLAFAGIFICVFNFHFERYGLRHNALSCAFMALIVVLSMKLKVGNPVLHWCGRHVFPIYMYQCLFFLLARCLYHGPMAILGAHLVVVLTLVPTLIVARFYHHWEIRA